MALPLNAAGRQPEVAMGMPDRGDEDAGCPCGSSLTFAGVLLPVTADSTPDFERAYGLRVAAANIQPGVRGCLAGAALRTALIEFAAYLLDHTSSQEKGDQLWSLTQKNPRARSTTVEISDSALTCSATPA